MTIDEAIEHCAEWLEELKDYRRFNGAKTFDNGFKQGEKYGYKKTIDDFRNAILRKYTEEERNNNFKFYACQIKQDISDIAEELKKECAECK